MIDAAVAVLKSVLTATRLRVIGIVGLILSVPFLVLLLIPVTPTQPLLDALRPHLIEFFVAALASIGLVLIPTVEEISDSIGIWWKVQRFCKNHILHVMEDECAHFCIAIILKENLIPFSRHKFGGLSYRGIVHEIADNGEQERVWQIDQAIFEYCQRKRSAVLSRLFKQSRGLPATIVAVAPRQEATVVQRYVEANSKELGLTKPQLDAVKRARSGIRTVRRIVLSFKDSNEIGGDL